MIKEKWNSFFVFVFYILICFSCSQNNNAENINFSSEIVDLKFTQNTFQYLLNNSFQELAKSEKETYLDLLTEISSNFADQYDLQNSLTAIFYGLHLIESSDDNTVFFNYKNQFLESYLNIVMNESIQYISTIPTVVDMIKMNYKSIQKNDIDSYLNLLYLDKNDIDSDKVLELNLPNSLKEKMITHLGFLEFGKNPKKAIELFSISLNLIEGIDYRKQVLHIYKAYCYLELENMVNIEIEIKKARNSNSLSTSDKNSLAFLITRLELEVLAKSNNCKAIVSKIIALRKIAKTAFAGHKSLHLEDFYSQNTVEFLTHLQSCDINASSNSNDIMRLFYESKILTENNLLGINFTKNTSSNKDLLRVNDFLTFDNLSDPVYERLFQESMQEYIQKSKSIQQDIRLEKNIENTDSTIVNFIAYNTDYGVYVKNGDEFNIHLINRNRIDSLSSILIEYIKTDKEINMICKMIQHELSFINNISDSIVINILPDGELTFIPFDVIFPNKKFIYLKSVDQLNSGAHNIKLNQGAIYSFSNKATITDKGVRQIPELAEAFEESLRINKITSAPILSGKQLTKESFKDGLRSAFIHIATHGKSNKTSRLDNYLIVRKSNELDTLYSFEILDFGQAPQVAILSSCSTGTGSFIIGSGTFSIANALYRNGTKNIVKTLWPIDDRASRNFMEKMYSYWVSGESLYSAIQRTKNDFKDGNQPIKNWAGFILDGPGNVYLE